MTFQNKISILLILILAACGSSEPPISLDEDFTQPVEEERSAIFSEIENEVQARESTSLDFTSAIVGDVLFVGVQAKTLDNGRARIDVIPEGTIIRMSNNSLITLSSLNTDPVNPITRIQLTLGDLWIILQGGELEGQYIFRKSSCTRQHDGIGIQRCYRIPAGYLFGRLVFSEQRSWDHRIRRR